MLRRHCAKAVLATSVGFPQLAMRFKGWTADAAELERERSLRQQLQQKYRNMKLPEMTSITYGTHASSQRFGESSGSSTSDTTSQSSGSNGGVDWIMFLTGLALLYAGSQLLANRMSGPSGNDKNMIVPLWCMPYQSQARYLLYLVATEKLTREQLEQEFKQVRVAYPTIGFMDWLESRYPAYGSGKYVTRQTAVDTLVHVLSNGTQFQLAGLGRILRNAMNQPGDPQMKVDKFVSEVETVAGIAARLPAPPSMSHYAPPAHMPQPLAYPGTYAPPPYSPAPAYIPPQTPSSAAHSTGAQVITLDDVLGSVQGSGNKASP